MPTLAYAPFAFVNLLNPLLAIIYGIVNFKIVKIDEGESGSVKQAAKASA